MGRTVSWIKWCQNISGGIHCAKKNCPLFLSIYTFPIFDNPVNLLLYTLLCIHLYLKIKIAVIVLLLSYKAVGVFSFCTCAMHLVSLNPKQNSTPTVICKHNNKWLSLHIFITQWFSSWKNDHPLFLIQIKKIFTISLCTAAQCSYLAPEVHPSPTKNKNYRHSSRQQLTNSMLAFFPSFLRKHKSHGRET